MSAKKKARPQMWTYYMPTCDGKPAWRNGFSGILWSVNDESPTLARDLKTVRSWIAVSKRKLPGLEREYGYLRVRVPR